MGIGLLSALCLFSRHNVINSVTFKEWHSKDDIRILGTKYKSFGPSASFTVHWNRSRQVHTMRIHNPNTLMSPISMISYFTSGITTCTFMIQARRLKRAYQQTSVINAPFYTPKHTDAHTPTAHALVKQDTWLKPCWCLFTRLHFLLLIGGIFLVLRGHHINHINTGLKYNSGVAQELITRWGRGKWPIDGGYQMHLGSPVT